MRRALRLALVGSTVLASCTQTPALWGTYSTPTSEASESTYAIPAGPTLPTAAAFPVFTATSTLAPFPTLMPAPSVTPLPSFTPVASVTQTAEATQVPAPMTPTFDVPATLYYAQSGDTLSALAARFSVGAAEIRSDSPLPPVGLISPGTLLVIPDRITDSTTPNVQLMPDSEVVFSGTATDFDINAYIAAATGKLSTYKEYLGSTGWMTGPQEIRRLAFENSINPRLLLAILDYESRWVRAQPVDSMHADYPMGYLNVFYKGMFSQMVWAVNQLSIGYYGWRTGTVTQLQFPDGTRLRIDPRLNAGTVALQYLFSKLHDQSQWAQMIDTKNGFPATYQQMFGDPWARAASLGPLFPPGISQPELALPFEPKTEWNLTGGPHGAWEHDGSLAAVDFAPSTDHGGCDPTPTWVTAAAAGMIVRSERGVVIEDLDGDGFEQTGWDLVYLHIATEGRVPAGTYVQKNDHIGHASCEGGAATGTHVHFVRKYNGEWVAADGPLPFVVGGWTIHQGALAYEGTMTRGDQVIIASPAGELKSVIIRQPNDQ